MLLSRPVLALRALVPEVAAPFVIDAATGVAKAASDGRQFLAFPIAETGLQVMVVQDSSASTAAAALCVGAGHMLDPPTVPGLHHFLEHMIGMGSATFPGEDELKAFLKRHGGSYNASTNADRTQFYLTVTDEHLDGALSRMAAAFAEPLLSASSAGREVRAVDSEFRKNLSSDDRRLFQLIRLLSADHHPWKRFGTGDLRSLCGRHSAEDAEVAAPVGLLRYAHQHHYRSQRTTLAVVSPRPAEALRHLVMESFLEPARVRAAEPDAARTPSSAAVTWPMFRDAAEAGHPLLPGGVARHVWLVPKRPRRQLIALFPIPHASRAATNAAHALAVHVLGHEGRGSLLQALKARELATGVVASRTVGEAFSTLEVAVTLTESADSSADRQRVASLLFEACRRIATSDASELTRVFEQLRQLRSASLRYRPQSSPLNEALSLSEALGLWQPEVAPVASSVLPPLESGDLGMLRALHAGNCLLIHVSPTPAAPEIPWQTEPWYGSRWAQTAFTPAELGRWGLSADRAELLSSAAARWTSSGAWAGTPDAGAVAAGIAERVDIETSSVSPEACKVRLSDAVAAMLRHDLVSPGAYQVMLDEHVAPIRIEPADEVDMELSLPPPNPFIPESFDVIDSSLDIPPADEILARAAQLPKPDLRPESLAEFRTALSVSREARLTCAAQRFPPALLVHSSRSTTESIRVDVWHRPGHFTLPHASISAVIHLPRATAVIDRLEARVALEVLVSAMRDLLEEVVYDAAVARYSVAMDSTAQGFSLRVAGFADKLPCVLTTLLDELARQLRDSRRLAVACRRQAELLARSAEAQAQQQPIDYAAQLTRESALELLMILAEEPRTHTIAERRATAARSMMSSLDTASPDDSLGQIAQLLASMSTAHVVVTALGNLTPSTAIAASESLAAALPGLASALSAPCEEVDCSASVPRVDGILAPRACVPTAGGERRMAAAHTNPADLNSAARVTLVMVDGSSEAALTADVLPGPRDRLEALTLLAHRALQHAFFHELRTVQQTGYIVHCRFGELVSAPVMVFEAQSPEKSAAEIEGRIRDFLRDHAARTIASLSDAQFEALREATAINSWTANTSQSQESSRLEDVVEGGTYDMLANARLTAALDDLSRDDLERFVADFLAEGAPRRRAIWALVQASTTPVAFMREELAEKDWLPSKRLGLAVEHAATTAVDERGELAGLAGQAARGSHCAAAHD